MRTHVWQRRLYTRCVSRSARTAFCQPAGEALQHSVGVGAFLCARHVATMRKPQKSKSLAGRAEQRNKHVGDGQQHAVIRLSCPLANKEKLEPVATGQKQAGANRCGGDPAARCAMRHRAMFGTQASCTLRSEALRALHAQACVHRGNGTGADRRDARSRSAEPAMWKRVHPQNRP